MSLSRSRSLTFLLVLSLTLAGCLLPGCTKQPGVPDPLDDYKPVMQLAVSLAMDRLLTAHPELAPQAVQVTTVTIDALNGGKFTAVAEALAFYRSLIPFDKMDEDARVLIEYTLTALVEQMRLAADRYSLPQSARLTLLRECVQWSHDVAVRHVQEESQAAQAGKRKKIRAMR